MTASSLHNKIKIRDLKNSDAKKDREIISQFFPDCPLMQLPEYGAWHEKSGRDVKRFFVYYDGRPVLYCQLVRTVMREGMTYWYAPYGPRIAQGFAVDVGAHEDLLGEIYKKFIAHIREHHVNASDVFIRFDEIGEWYRRMSGYWFSGSEIVRSTKSSLYGAYFQPRAEWRLNIDAANRNEKEILAAMHQKTRYSINLSLRKEELNVRIVTNGLASRADDFHKLMTVTAARDNFHLHSCDYYRNLLASCDKDRASLPAYFIEVRVGDELVVMNLIIHVGTTAYYLFGTSSNQHRNLMPAYRAQWEAMLEARKRGAQWYNFGGISTKEFPHKGWEGITIFKEKFGGEPVLHSTTCDVPLRRIWYIVYIIRKYFLCLLKR